MKTAFFDCFAGVAGDMTLGALIDLGVEPDRIESAVRSLGLDGFSFAVSNEERASIGATRVVIEVTGKQPHRHLHHIEEILESGELSEAVRERCRKVFRRLCEAEASVHRVAIEKVHLHEVGAVDAIVDVVGSIVGLEALGVERVVSSPLVVGSGMTRGEHGPIPIPGPATLELLRGLPIRSGPVEAEMTTPTGAALVSTLAVGFGPMPPFAVEQIGYGCGSRSFDELPNLLRIVVGESGGDAGVELESVTLLEANLDDVSPQVLAYATSLILEEGALDVWVAPVLMKKGRSGQVLSVLARNDHAGRLADLIMRETTTLGVRFHETNRRILTRRIDKVEIPEGPIRIKVGLMGDEVRNAVPEYEDCAEAARRSGRPLKEIQTAAIERWRS